MNLYALNPKLASNLSSFSRKYNLGLNVLKSPDRLDGLIVLGDGTPDDWAVSLISHHLDGSKTVGIVKPPGKTGTSTFGLVHSYLIPDNAPKTIAFFIDQEESNISEISRELEQTLTKQHITNKLNSQAGERFKVYDCSIGQRQFKLALVINGLDEIPSKNHKIEDHLLKAAADLNLVNLPKEIIDPKDFWRSSLNEKAQETVFRSLIDHRKTCETLFPQQINGCNCLKS